MIWPEWGWTAWWCIMALPLLWMTLEIVAYWVKNSAAWKARRAYKAYEKHLRKLTNDFETDMVTTKDGRRITATEAAAAKYDIGVDPAIYTPKLDNRVWPIGFPSKETPLTATEAKTEADSKLTAEDWEKWVASLYQPKNVFWGKSVTECLVDDYHYKKGGKTRCSELLWKRS